MYRRYVILNGIIFLMLLFSSIDLCEIYILNYIYIQKIHILYLLFNFITTIILLQVTPTVHVHIRM